MKGNKNAAKLKKRVSSFKIMINKTPNHNKATNQIGF